MILLLSQHNFLSGQGHEQQYFCNLRSTKMVFDVDGLEHLVSCTRIREVNIKWV